MALFCSSCQAYLGAHQACPACGQARPDPATATPRWTVELEARPGGSPAVAGGCLFVHLRGEPTAEHSTLLCLDLSSQELRWRCRLENLLVHEPMLPYPANIELSEDEQVLYIGARSSHPLGEGALLAVEAATGHERWRWAPGAQAVSAPCLVQDLLYVVIDGNELCAIEADSGRERWRLSLPLPRSVAAPAASLELPDRLFLPSRGPHLCSVDTNAKTVLWHHDSPEEVGAWFLETPAVVEGRLCAVSTAGAVLALDARSGARLWRQVPGRQGKPLSPPTAAGQRLYVGTSDGLCALNVADGRQVWSFATERRISARPALADGVVYAAAHDHQLYALEAATGQKLWQTGTQRRIEASPVLSGDLMVAVDRGGQIVAAERVLSAEAYGAQGRWLEAAAIYARRGELSTAASIYLEQLGQPLLAAELWKVAGSLQQAALVYKQAGHYDLAEACYEQLGQACQVAEMAALQGDDERAANLFEQEGEWAQARTCWERLGDRRKVAELSEQLGDWQRAAAEWQALEESARAARAMWQAGAWLEAAWLYEAMEDWPQAADCYAQAGDWEKVGILRLRLNDAAAAAKAFAQAAHSLEQAGPGDEERLVQLWTEAEDAFRRAGDEAGVKTCGRALANLLQLPFIEVEVVAPETMNKEAYALVEFVLHNRGGGSAPRIVVHHTSSEFAGDLAHTREIGGLGPGECLSQFASLRPLVSGPVPLIFDIDYTDLAGDLHKITFRTHFNVVEQAPQSPMPVRSRPVHPTTESTFADFELLICRLERDGYPVHVLRSPAGEAKGVLRLPLPWAELEEIIKCLGFGEVDEQYLRDVGAGLFDALFAGDVRGRFRASQGMTAHGKGLRLRLRVESGDLVPLPWELLYDTARDVFLSLSQRTPVVHCLSVPRPSVAHPVDLPLRMLVVPSSPAEMAQLNVQAEVESLKAAVQPLVREGALVLDVLLPPTISALRERLLDAPYHILHFIGHGASDGRQICLAFESAQGRPDLLDGERLGMLLDATSVRLAVLSACLTAQGGIREVDGASQHSCQGVAPALVNAGLLAVVGMQFSLADESARLFSEGFYKALARHRPVDEAVDQARLAVTTESGLGCRDWAAPVLFLRGGSGEVFPAS